MSCRVAESRACRVAESRACRAGLAVVMSGFCLCGTPKGVVLLGDHRTQVLSSHFAFLDLSLGTTAQVGGLGHRGFATLQSHAQNRDSVGS